MAKRKKTGRKPEKKDRLILALDLGTKTGVAWSVNGEFQSHHTDLWHFQPLRHEGGGMRFLRFRRKLDTMQATEVYYEEVARHAGTTAAHVYGGFVAEVTAWCEEHGVPYRGVPVGTIKKHATGKGNANKQAMLTAAHQRLGYAGDSDDEADALWLLHLMLEEGAANA
jgi:hypothetical protein